MSLSDASTLFVIRSYYQSELAMLYYPDMNPKYAVRRLKRCMLADPQLMAAMWESSYRLINRQFTPKQVAHIIYWMGKPGL